MKHSIYKIPGKSSPCLYPLQHELNHTSNLKCFYTVVLYQLFFEIIYLLLLYIANMARSSLTYMHHLNYAVRTIIKSFQRNLNHFRRKLQA